MSKKQSYYIQLDLVILLLSLITVSILAIYNAQQLGQYHDNFVVKQIIYYALGLLLLIAIQFVDLEQLYKSSLYLYIFGVLLLVLLYFSPHSIARPVNNAKSWFHEIPFVTVQPLEIAKVFFIFFIESIIVKQSKKFVYSTLNCI